ncbi:MAG TPA: sensor histidine kinase [Steroidobacteraceae bacterium]|nr:sensor histidine kinase [Steroidobacteraceae bacterium]
MTSQSSNPTQEPERYLADILHELSAAATREAGVRIVARAARTLAGAEGMCILSAVGDRCIVALAQHSQVHECDLRSSSIHRGAGPLLRSEASGAQVLWGKEDTIVLPTGERQRVGAALIVPLAPASGHPAVGFFWGPGETVEAQTARRLELLAKALALAAAMWRKVEESAAREQQRLQSDVQHRLRNNLATIRSVIRRSYETAESAEHFALHVQARAGALARMQGVLASIGEAGVDLEDLIRTELSASAAPEQGYSLQGPEVRLHMRGAEVLTLAVHELATNSLKFGALGAPGGQLAIAWRVEGPQPHLHLTWVESGVTIATVAPRRRGFGLELIECTLPYEIGAQTRLAFSPGGVECKIEIPLEACAIVEAQAWQSAQGG